MTSPRYQRLDPCAECGACSGNLCAPARHSPLRTYTGLRFTSDSFDCALPVSLDTHSHCSYGCLYCFSDNLMQHREGAGRPLGQQRLDTLRALFSGEGGERLALYRKALHYDDKQNGYPCPLQVGAINDPCDHIERQQGWLLQLIPLAIRYGQPLRLSTKGTVLALPEYQAALAEAPHLFWVAFSIISPDDDLVRRTDRRAPVPSERLATMAALSKLGVRTSLRLRPMLPGLSDRTPKYPHAYRTLIERAAEAGARAISYEVAFVPGMGNADVRERWEHLGRIAGVPFYSLYRKFGPIQACMRPSYGWTEDIMHAVAEVAHANGMTVGVSDPVWKQLNDTGCCCGILPDDPVFGNWQRESATNQFVLARDTGKVLGPDDVIPEWARDVLYGDLANPGVGPTVQYKRRHWTWADETRRKWNDPRAQRGPLQYFQGALQPTGRTPAGDLLYKYVGLPRQHQHGFYWHVEQPVSPGG